MADLLAGAISEMPAPRVIPTPADFPVRWERPEEAQAFWTREVMHFPEQVLPMVTMVDSFINHGFDTMSEAYALPVRIINRTINTYLYIAVMPAVPLEQMEEQGKRAEEKLHAAMPRFNERWETEYLPEIQQFLALCARFDLPCATTLELLEHFDQVLAGMYRAWDIHMLMAMMFHLPRSLFTDLCTDLFGDEGAFAAFDLLQGIDNKTLATDREIWRLSRLALIDPAVRRVLEEQSAADALRSLAGSVEGEAFLTDLHAFLAVYGQRGSHFFDFEKPSWIDDPAPVIQNIKDYMRQAARDPVAELAAFAAERERLVGEARQRLVGYPQAAVGQFEFLLKAAQDATRISEDHNFWIDCQCMYQFRRVIVEMANRLVAAGAIAERDDVFFLTHDETRKSLAQSLDQRALVDERKAMVAQFAAVQAPFALGTEPSGPPPDDPVGRALGRFFGGPPKQSTEPGLLLGNAGSRGVVRGTARVIRSLAEASKLQPGDILVAETTSPPWTPLFATVVAVVTETGGILSHCAVVAREYMIPAVVGVGRATHVIQDGQLLEVDGTAGTVRIIG